ncbi:MAG: hypothetical protein IJW00_01170 [Clostridia bacterium]|nr:hypothetical protein [Clostridia bacterium]
MDDMYMYKYTDRVTDKEAFLRFIQLLIDDYRKNPQDWEYNSIDGYLDGMMAWIDDFSKCPSNDIDWNKIDYSIIAKILYMGKIYE